MPELFKAAIAGGAETEPAQQQQSAMVNKAIFSTDLIQILLQQLFT